MKRTAQPELSILLVADSTAAVMRTLGCYGESIDKSRLEIVIVARNSVELLATPIIAAGFPNVKMQSISGDSFDQAEARAVEAATASYVVFALPTGHPRPGYVDVIRAAVVSGDWSVIGPCLVDAKPGNALSWAVMWIFHAPWMHHPPRGPMESVPGHHSAYRREALLDLGDTLAASLVASEILLGELRARGHRFLFEPAAEVEVVTASRPADFIGCLFQNARQYAAKRRRPWSLVRRLIYGVGSPLIPLVRILRIHRHIRRAGSDRVAALRYPLLLGGLAVSALGEMTGYLLGPGPNWRYEHWSEEP